MEDITPKLFISYSWSNPEHEQWVLSLATELRDSGVDVVLDKWDLKEGQDANSFMEQMVTDESIGRVLIICDRVYADKANGRAGGVGTETQIISAEVYAKKDQSKFVAVLAEKDSEGSPCLPAYYKSRIYVDLSDNDLYAKNFEQLLRWIFDQPLYEKPAIGKKPSFLNESTGPSLGTSVAFKRSLDAIRNNKDYCVGAINEYFDLFVENIERFRIQKDENEFDDLVVKTIDQFIPFRNEAIALFLALAQYRGTTETAQIIHRFFESLVPYMDVPDGVNSYSEWDFDNFKFIIHELFLYCIASFLKYEQFDVVCYLLRHEYFVEHKANRGIEPMRNFAIFREHMPSLEHRNNRLKLQRLSVRADMLEKRSEASGLKFIQLMQADFFLFMRDAIKSFRNEEYQDWWPETLLYVGWRGRVFELFSRAQSKEYWSKIMCLLDVQSKEDLQPVLAAFEERKLSIPRWEATSFNPRSLANYDALATKA